MNCFRYLGFTSFEQVDRVTIPEYHLLIEAINFRETDRDFWVHWQAFQNFRVKATKRVGKNKQKPVHSRFDKFYDYDAALKKIRSGGKKPDRYTKLKAHLKKKGG